MTMSWLGNTFYIIGPLWGESTCGFHSQMASNAELWCFHWYDHEQVEQTVELSVISDPLMLMSPWWVIFAQNLPNTIYCVSTYSKLTLKVTRFWKCGVITGINLEAVKWGVDCYDRLLCPGLQPGPPSQTPGGLGQRYWSVSEVMWPTQLELRRWRSSGPSSVMVSANVIKHHE